MFLKVSFTGKAEATSRAVEVSLALVMHGSPVVLQGALVAEGGVADVAVEDVAGVGSQDVSGQTGLAGEGGVAGVALVGLVGAVGLHVPGQGLLVLELHPALGTRVGLGVVGVVELLVDCQMVLPGEGLGALPAPVGLPARVDCGVALRLLLRPEAPATDPTLQGPYGEGIAVGPLPMLDL